MYGCRSAAGIDLRADGLSLENSFKQRVKSMTLASVLISIGFQLTFGAFFMVVLDQQTGWHAGPSASAVLEENPAAAMTSLETRNSGI